jgi:hypothetical protein
MNLAEAIRFVNHTGFNHSQGRGGEDGFQRTQMTITQIR